MTLSRIMLSILILNVLVTLGGIGGQYWLMRSQGVFPAAEFSGKEGPGEAAPEKPAEYQFFPVEKIIINVADESREHYFVLDLALQVDLEANPERLERISPLVRNSVVTLLSAMSYEQLRQKTIPQLQDSLEVVLKADLSAQHVVVPFSRVLVSKLIVQ